MATLTQAEMARFENERREGRLFELHKRFRENYAPSDPRERDEFEALLSALTQAIVEAHLKPFHEAAGRALAMTRVPPIVLDKD